MLKALLPALGTRPLIMGVLNATPDSFSARHPEPRAAIAAGLAMIEEGADLLDIGGESTRPGAEEVAAALELARVLPVIEGLAGRVPISIDTAKAAVAARALDAGASIVNDISGGSFDPEMFPLVAARRAGYVLMHTRGRPAEMQRGEWTYEGGVVEAVARHLETRLAAAARAGIDPEAVALDPGLGFGKTVEENCALVAGLERFSSLGRPLLVGPSNKSFLGALTGRAVGERTIATMAAVALAVGAGASILRVHEVRAARDAAAVAWACRRPRACD